MAAAAASGVLGAVSTVAWAPLSWWPVGVVAYAFVFLVMLRGMPLPRLASCIAAFTFVQVAVAYAWGLPMLFRHAGFSFSAAAVVFLIFCGYLSLFPVFFCGLWWFVVRPDRRPMGGVSLSAALSFSALLVLGEWLRDALAPDFASLAFGYALIDSPFGGLAPVGGVYGVSFLSYFSACMLGAFRRIDRSAIFPAFVLVVVVGSGFVAGGYEWSLPAGRPMTYRLIQPLVEQGEKFDARHAHDILQRLKQQMTLSGATVVLTPETASPAFFNDLPPGFVQSLRAFASSTHSHLFFGVPVFSGAGAAHNALVHLSPGSGPAVSAVYKSRLMPLGEYTPTGLSWLSRRLAIPLSDLSPGVSEQRPFRVESGSVGALICLEDASSRLTRLLARDVGFFVNPVNLAWFSGNVAISRALAVARMRAAEVARPVLRAANSGVTAHIDEHGVVVQSLPWERPGILSGNVQPVSGETPFLRWGDTLTLLVVGVSGLCGMIACRRRKPAMR